MKKSLRLFTTLLFVIGCLCAGVGTIAVFLGNTHISKYNAAVRTGEKVQVEIIDKGISRSGGGSSKTGHSTHYFHIPFLGAEGERKVTMIYPTPEEFDSYTVGSLLMVAYSRDDPSEAFIIKSTEELSHIKRKPFSLIFFGVIMIACALVFSKIAKEP
jgi:hypothetical protein